MKRFKKTKVQYEKKKKINYELNGMFFTVLKQEVSDYDKGLEFAFVSNVFLLLRRLDLLFESFF